MKVLILPKGCCDDLMRMFARFRWGSSVEKRKIHWLRWEKMCWLKELGGLNFRDLEGFNQALLAKQVWRCLTNPNLLISKILKAKYFPLSSSIETKIGKQPSYFFMSFMWGQELLAQSLRRRVGDGRSIRSFKDGWLPCPSTFKPFAAVNSNLDYMMAEFIRPSRSWDISRIEQVFRPKDVDIIRSIPLGRVPKEDSWVWHYDKKENYTVQNDYKLFMHLKMEASTSNHEATKRIWTRLWKLNLPPKIKHFL